MPRRLTDHDLAQWRRAHGEPDVPIPPKPRKRGNEEHRAQRALMQWWDAAHAGFGVARELFFAVPNGGWRDPIGAAILKAEGQRNGVSDLLLLVPTPSYFGLCLEMKHERGRPSPEQLEFIRLVKERGYAGVVCYGFDSAKQTVEKYLAGGLL